MKDVWHDELEDFAKDKSVQVGHAEKADTNGDEATELYLVVAVYAFEGAFGDLFVIDDCCAAASNNKEAKHEPPDAKCPFHENILAYILHSSGFSSRIGGVRGYSSAG